MELTELLKVVNEVAQAALTISAALAAIVAAIQGTKWANGKRAIQRIEEVRQGMETVEAVTRTVVEATEQWAGTPKRLQKGTTTELCSPSGRMKKARALGVAKAIVSSLPVSVKDEHLDAAIEAAVLWLPKRKEAIAEIDKGIEPSVN